MDVGGPRLRLLLDERIIRKQVDGAVEVILGMRGSGYYPGVGAVDRLTRLCLEEDRWEEVMSVLTREGIPVHEGTYRYVLETTAVQGQVPYALAILEEMKHAGLKVDQNAYILALRACAEAGEWQEAMRLERDRRQKLGKGGGGGGGSTASPQALILKALVRGNQVSKAIALLEEEGIGGGEVDASPWIIALMEGCLPHPSSLFPDQGKGAAVLSEALSTLDRLRGNEWWTKEMEASAMIPILVLCKKMGLWKEARDLLIAVQQQSAGGESASSLIKSKSLLPSSSALRAVHYSLAIGACGMATPPQVGREVGR